MNYVFSDADVLIKLVRSGLWIHFEKLINIRKWKVHIPSYVLHTEIKNKDKNVYNLLITKIESEKIFEIDSKVESDNPITERFINFSLHVDDGEAHVFALAESMNAIVITDNISDLNIIKNTYNVKFKSYTLYQICYLIYKEKLLTDIQINKHISKLVQTHDINSSDSVIRFGFQKVIFRLEKEKFD
ncbi:MAG: hypothetical protein GF353_07170 [Candidatus Lokiarchaeota archaeon]|nr:hypothetical protein [Candidatus Lokiarchaeota archaeon]